MSKWQFPCSLNTKLEKTYFIVDRALTFFFFFGLRDKSCHSGKGPRKTIKLLSSLRRVTAISTICKEPKDAHVLVHILFLVSLPAWGFANKTDIEGYQRTDTNQTKELFQLQLLRQM